MSHSGGAHWYWKRLHVCDGGEYVRNLYFLLTFAGNLTLLWKLFFKIKVTPPHCKKKKNLTRVTNTKNIIFYCLAIIYAPHVTYIYCTCKIESASVTTHRSLHLSDWLWFREPPWGLDRTEGSISMATSGCSTAGLLPSLPWHQMLNTSQHTTSCNQYQIPWNPLHSTLNAIFTTKFLRILVIFPLKLFGDSNS